MILVTIRNDTKCATCLLISSKSPIKKPTLNSAILSVFFCGDLFGHESLVDVWEGLAVVVVQHSTGDFGKYLSLPERHKRVYLREKSA